MSYATIYRTRPRYIHRSKPVQNLHTVADHPVNLMEGKNFFRLELAAPGRSKDDFKLEVKEGQLVIQVKGEESSSNGYRVREFKKVPFEKQFTLGNKIDPEGIKANYEKGILYVTLPVKAPKVVEIA
jgi:HSP20 family protein